MAISAAYTSGLNVYFVIFDENGLVWNNGWESVDNSRWLGYVYAMVEEGTTGNYFGTFPDTIGAGTYFITGYQQLGGSPSPFDHKILSGAIEWNGASEGGGAGCTEQELSISVGAPTDAPSFSGGVRDSFTADSITPVEGRSTDNVEVSPVTGVSTDTVDITSGVSRTRVQIDIKPGIK